MAYLDRDAQPHPAIHSVANLRKTLEGLLGLCTGLIADNVLNEDETVFLRGWLAQNDILLETWPGQILWDRLSDILADGVVTADEAEDLKDTIAALTGGDLEHGLLSGGAMTWPVDRDAHVTIPDKRFCFTGKFLYGSRKACERTITDAGGRTTTHITKKLDYLVIGSLSSRDWKYSSYGTKIDAAMEAQGEGRELVIVGEEQWVNAVSDQTGPRHS